MSPYNKNAIKCLKKNQSLSTILLHKMVSKKYNDFDISPDHLHHVIRDNNITRKRTKVKHYPEFRYGKKTNLKKELKTFFDKTKKIPLNKIISFDETSIHAIMIPSYSRCDLRKRCVQKTNNSKVFKKYTLSVAISSLGVVGYELYESGGMTHERLNNFIRKHISGKFKGYTIIMDNAGSHRNNSTKVLIENSGNTLLHSVPYHPSTNAIESWFSQYKRLLHNEPGLEYSEILKNVKKAFRKIKKQENLNYFKYAYRRDYTKIKSTKKSSRRKKSKNYKI